MTLNKNRRYQIMTTQRTDPGYSNRKRTNLAALAGWIVVLVCSLLIYDALLFSSLNKEIWNDMQASARVAADNLRLNVATGVRFGKKLESYRGLDITKQCPRNNGLELK